MPAIIPPSGLVSFTIISGGSAIPSEIEVLSVFTEQKINHVSTARIVMRDGNAAEGSFDISSSSTFVPGQEIVIEAGYDNTNQLIFKGIVIAQSICIHETHGPSLQVECSDAAVQMTVGNKSTLYSNKKDSDIMASLLANYGSLTASVQPTSTILPNRVQLNTTDWDYLLALAGSNSMVVAQQYGKVSVMDPNADTAATATLTYGDNILSLDIEMDSTNQLSKVKTSSWDYTTQSVISQQQSNSIQGAGNISSSTLSQVIGLSDYPVQTTAALQQQELANVAKAVITQHCFAKFNGKVKTMGTSIIEAGKYITLSGIGDRFNGNHFVEGVQHRIAEGNWFTEAYLGLPVHNEKAACVMPEATGLFNGKVIKHFQDPDNQYRILVDIPMFNGDGEGVWARLSNFYASSGAGAFFLPEVGDEVVLGFLDGHLSYPVILGSMYSSYSQLPKNGLVPNESNALKAIATKSGLLLGFDDDNHIVSIVTPNKNSIVLSDKDKQVCLQDENGNSIILSSSGITIRSSKDVIIVANQRVDINGEQAVSVGSSDAVSIKADTELTLQASMIKIN